MGGATKLMQRLEEEGSWKVNGISAASRKTGYWFSITQTGSLSPILVTASLSGLQSDQLESIRQAAAPMRKKPVLAQFSHSNQVLSFLLQSNTDATKNLDRINQLTEALAAEFKRLGLVDGCHFCGARDAANPVRVGDRTAVACDGCLNRLQQQAASTREKNEMQGNYLTGLIGAVLGALIGAALWVAVARLGYVAAIVGFVMAYLAQAGYRLLKGRIQKGMPVIVLFAVIAGLFTATAANVAIGLVTDPAVGLAWGEAIRVAPQAFYNNELFYVSEVWKEIAMGVFFALLGSFGLIRKLFREAKGETYEVVQI